jgi:hypothetical protein
MTDGGDILRELLALTPLPPEGDAETVLVAFDAMFDARQQVLVRITGKLGDTEENRAMLCELAARDAAWERVLTSTRAAVGAARSGTKALRSYAR